MLFLKIYVCSRELRKHVKFITISVICGEGQITNADGTACICQNGQPLNDDGTCTTTTITTTSTTITTTTTTFPLGV